MRIVPLGGLEEVGRNMMYIEYVDNTSAHHGDIIIIDMGLQFPEENMPGIDYIVPQVASLIPKRKNIKGVIITHAHYDHIGAIPHLMPELGAKIPMYGTDITIAIIKKRQDDFKNGRHELNLKEINNNTKLQLGAFHVEFYGVSHNVPGSVGVIINSPVGTLIHTGDFKLDLKSDIAGHTEIEKIKSLGEKNVLLLMSDSTNAPQTGHQFSEVEIQTEIEKIMQNAKGKLYFATFASLLGRINEIIQLAQKYKKKVAIDGRSMKTNIAIATELGYMKYDPKIIIPVEKVKEYPDNKVIILVTGAQGEGQAVLMRVVNKRHKCLRIEPGDTVVFSSSVIPGNERSVQALTDKLYRDGAEVVNYRMLDIHAGGHAKQEDLKLMIQLIKPHYFMPIEGNHSFLKIHARLASELNLKKEQILVADNGQVVVATKDLVTLTDERVPANYVMVDGLGVGDVQEVVLRDRQAMAEDGIFVIITVVDAQTGKVRGSPDIISRGFVYLRESKELIFETRKRIRKTVEDITQEMHPINFQYIKESLRDKIGQFLFQKTERRPMVLPVIIEV
ncbi:MAG: hypothetical protein A3C80_03445 [Candidatus Ryanbacteria bacterium RIFCSPHIGHO2_02_FULL_45_43]|uniref:Ribonuclease J n=1 Tax=Candidatus Ryanbacteria bacterium RIFCSPHIGHO2_01_45_13 TaxID=1802112 RepID=A0A1G2FTG7_9BACT|nr:MAG: hypothetical protein A2W41_01390 [Candidatus Ryanbacteria bacterium RIFCSPHIGHO2_01_45_13]OGZ41548.1 MAG: hypothetical protein A2718_03710 [Candidatus Ryanbacteria bacterium RIFCSPHIGHO2_01_FULL_44_130]OGZ48016.1 MAG: hypothetical protein A3C80_03445 [Candidatus Ryanbacteria bacterium RIFCSPHIGHO2_02_FULL_45_43]OGZ50150.1 MAG: hypothetical protein A3E55_01310 [Candidatus Ryanbacteria bacterium RIFCSPHIGHO2_12_FULL_44_20]OGZ51153.1 MAG: hypothetical protein A3A17_03750 [Candidatus Ryanba